MMRAPLETTERRSDRIQPGDIIVNNSYRRDARLQVVIFAFTLVADFLIIFTEHFAIGIAVFCGAHLTATNRYAGIKRAKAMAVIAFAFAVTIIVIAITQAVASNTSERLITLLSGGEETNPWRYAVSAAPYALLITAATVSAFKRRQAPVNNILSRLGMTLFVLCDVNVLLWNLRGAMEMTAIPAWTGTLIWTFYLPAQTMLALSAHDFESADSKRQA
jgi:hypothetical protein